MGLAEEAEKLYIYSSWLEKLNRKLRKLGRKAEKHRRRHEAAPEHKKEKHRIRHALTIQEIRELMKQHDEVLGGLKRHYLRFVYYLKEEHKL